MLMEILNVLASCVLVQSLQMKTVLAALRGRPVPRGKLKAKCVVVNLWMRLGARCAQVQNAPLLSLQMKMVCVALRSRHVQRVKKLAKHVEEDQ